MKMDKKENIETTQHGVIDEMKFHVMTAPGSGQTVCGIKTATAAGVPLMDLLTDPKFSMVRECEACTGMDYQKLESKKNFEASVKLSEELAKQPPPPDAKMEVTNEWPGLKHVFSERVQEIFKRNYAGTTLLERTVFTGLGFSLTNTPLEAYREVVYATFLGLHIRDVAEKEAAAKELGRVLDEMAGDNILCGVLIPLFSLPVTRLREGRTDLDLVTAGVRGDVELVKKLEADGPAQEPDGIILLSYPFTMSHSLAMKLYPNHVRHEGDKPLTWSKGKFVGGDK